MVARKLGISIPRGMRGLGQSTQQISAIAASGASATVGILVALGSIAGPIGAAVGALIGVGQLLVGVFKGCGQTCVEATAIVNQVEPILQQNLAAYLAAPVHTESLQAAAINNFQTAWNAVLANCNNPSLGSAGQNCISERQQGACAYKTSPGGWSNGVYTYPGANGSGTACWNWWIGYHDPIANDPTVVPDSVVTSASTSTASATSGTTGAVSTSETNYAPLLLIGAAALAAWLLL
jgi:hypothetical protein